MNKRVVLVAIVLLVFFPILETSHATNEPNPKAPWPTEEWSYASPEEQGMDSAQLEMMRDHFDENKIQIDGFIVIRNGWIVYEDYPSGYEPDDTHHLFSCTKSVTATLMGIALNSGYIESVETLILEFFQDYDFSNPSRSKSNISIRNLLEMTTGLSWNEDHYGTNLNDYNRMIRSDDWVQYVLDKPMTSEPGEYFYYNSGASHILSAIIQEATHNSTLDFAVTNLFSYLGIINYEWDQDPNGIYRGASHLKLAPNDMAKIGYLYLHSGLWDGIQVIPQEWVQMVASSQVNVDESKDYSYQWWVLPEFGAYYASGWGYQSIIVVPSYDLVVVVTAATLDSSVQVENLLGRWILPSLGQETTTSKSFTISPLFLFIGGSPFIVVAIVYFMDYRGYWDEIVIEED